MTSAVWNTHSGIQRSPEQDGRSDTCHNTDEPRDAMPSDLSQSLKDRYSTDPANSRFL